MTEVLTGLDDAHYDHLMGEGFTHDEIMVLENSYGVESIGRSRAIKLGIRKWDGTKHLTDGGLYFPFSSEYGQIRFNTPLEVAGEKLIKYLGPSKPAKAWYPLQDVKAITEGFKDAAIATLRGIPTAAIVGVDNIIHCISQWSETPIIFDSDGWCKPDVVRALVWGALWTNGRINLFPPMDAYPTGGACEFFKSGGTITEYQNLIDNAMTPHEFLLAWSDHWDGFDKDLQLKCARVATELSHVLEHPDKFIRHLEEKRQEKIESWIARQK